LDNPGAHSNSIVLIFTSVKVLSLGMKTGLEAIYFFQN